jgi:signal transduction protein with GAF and PtsI domain
MAFGTQIKETLRQRDRLVAAEFANGETLATVLTRGLQAVEAAADTDMLTSILLLEGNRLWHGAAPNLPRSYCMAIDGGEIGPSAGSCGTAAYCRHPIYVADVAKDPLWIDYRHLALEHGLQACWSTPIMDQAGAVLGTFAIYHLTARGPTRDEVRAIRTITEHVARAIAWWKGSSDASSEPVEAAGLAPLLRLVASADEDQQSMFKIGRDFEELLVLIDAALAKLTVADPASTLVAPLRRARAAAEKGVALARSAPSPE